VEER
jgi:hypothetical protein